MKSTSNYFHESEEVLMNRLINLHTYLTLMGYTPEQYKVYERAFLYFMDHPHQYDGATMTEDLYDIPWLDSDAMLHDYFYIAYNVGGSYKYAQIADRVMWEESRKKGKSSWNVNTRKVLLKLKSWIGWHLYIKLFKKRKMSQTNIDNFLKDIKTLRNGNK